MNPVLARPAMKLKWMCMLAASFRVVATIGLVTLLPANASAQEPSFGPISGSVKIGTRIRVIRPDGRRIEGPLTDLSSSSLTIKDENDPMATHVSVRDVGRIYKQGPKPWARNILIGFGVGAGITAIAMASEEHCGLLCGPEGVLVVSSVYGGIGAGIGALVAAASFGKPILVYERGVVQSSRFNVQPVITPARQGVIVSVRF